jgi:hypothetical protein
VKVNIGIAKTATSNGVSADANASNWANHIKHLKKHCFSDGRIQFANIERCRSSRRRRNGLLLLLLKGLLRGGVERLGLGIGCSGHDRNRFLMCFSKKKKVVVKRLQAKMKKKKKRRY